VFVVSSRRWKLCESSDKSMAYGDFKINYEADAIAEVIAVAEVTVGAYKSIRNQVAPDATESWRTLGLSKRTVRGIFAPLVLFPLLLLLLAGLVREVKRYRSRSS
jgi:hypothetical protein